MRPMKTERKRGARLRRDGPQSQVTEKSTSHLSNDVGSSQKPKSRTASGNWIMPQIIENKRGFELRNGERKTRKKTSRRAEIITSTIATKYVPHRRHIGPRTSREPENILSKKTRQTAR